MSFRLTTSEIIDYKRDKTNNYLLLTILWRITHNYFGSSCKHSGCAQNLVMDSNLNIFKINMGSGVYNFKSLCKPYIFQISFYFSPYLLQNDGYKFSNVYYWLLTFLFYSIRYLSKFLWQKLYEFRQNCLSNSTPQESFLPSWGTLPPHQTFWKNPSVFISKNLNTEVYYYEPQIKGIIERKIVVFKVSL